MGKPRGFLEDKRLDLKTIAPKDRIKNYKEFYIPLSKKERQIQAGRCMNCGVAFCHTGIIAKPQNIPESSTNQGVISCVETNSEPLGGGEIGCPLHNLIPEWNDLLYRGLWSEAYERLSLTNPFADLTGRICPAPCEDSCVCAINGDSVTIKNNELAIVENAFENNLIKPYKPTSRTNIKIAIIGSGPAGLTCAWELNAFGHNVVVFERSDRIGGLLMYGIPDMKLEKTIIERRVSIMEQSGIAFKPNTNIDSKEKVKALLWEFDYVILATGASQPLDLDIEGRESEGIMFALDFLTRNTKSILDTKKPDNLAEGKNVLIIGSGDTSIDCVAVATRQGAKSITRFERSPKRPESRPNTNPWPLRKQTFNTDYGLSEAIAHYGKDPREYQKLTKKFITKNGKVSGVVAVDLEWDIIGGKRVRQEIQGSEKEYKADLILLAMGFKGSEESVAKNFGVRLDSHTNIATQNYLTSHKKIYACGDAKMGQSLVVWAIRDGILCAKEVQKAIIPYKP